MLKRHARDPVSEISDVRELADYFADDGDDTGGQKGEEVNPVGKIDIRAQPMKRGPAIIKTDDEGDEGGGGGSKSSGKGGGDGDKSKGKNIRSSSGQYASKSIQLNNLRSVSLSATRRRLACTPDFSGNMELIVYEAGADRDRRLNVVKTSNGTIRSGIVRNLRARRGSRITLEIELDASFYGAMKVAAHAI